MESLFEHFKELSKGPTECNIDESRLPKDDAVNEQHELDVSCLNAIVTEAEIKKNCM